ncbi:MAG: hypothetical protein MUO40_03515 [Anaerolineaceae bacterium]|nr:hypothetical protein [Anaerolineaceae bacterium]
MKNKWLGITLTILVGVFLLVAVGFVSFRLGTLRGKMFASTEGLKTIVVSGDKGELPECAYLEKFPGKGEYISGMMETGENFEDFHGMMGSFGFRDNVRGFYPMDRFNSPMRSFSLLRGLFSLVLLAGLVLLIVFIVKAVHKTNDRSEKVVSAPVSEDVDSKQE